MEREPDTAAGTPSGQKILLVLETLGASPRPQRLGDIAAAARMTKPTAHRLLRLLTKEGWALAGDSGYYELGPRARALGRQADGDRAEEIEGAIRRLAAETEQTVHVGMRAGNEVLYTHKAAGPQPFSMRSRVGMRVPLHSSGIGKAILGWLPDDEVREVLATAGLRRCTPATITDPAELTEHLATAREAGYFTDLEENEPNVRCVAVPLRYDGRVVGGLSVSTISFVTPEEELMSYVPRVQQAAAAVAEMLG